MANLTQIGGQSGSNKGGLYQDTETGIKWYVKEPKSADIANNEVLTGKLYEAAGVEVPELHIGVGERHDPHLQQDDRRYGNRCRPA